MDKSEYIEMLKEEPVPTALLFEYWKEMKPADYTNLSYKEFRTKFTEFLELMAVNNIILTQNGPKRIVLANVIQKAKSYFETQINNTHD